jgi:DNA-binding SARP family transcriptional activator
MRGEETAGAPQLRFTVLGPVSIRRDDGELLPSGSPQQRALLAALLLRNGRTATAPELIDAIWGEDAPTQALAVTRTYASRLRKILGMNVLHSESGGYALRVPEDAVDLGMARRLSAEAQKLLAAGDVREARARMNEALGPGSVRRQPARPPGGVAPATPGGTSRRRPGDRRPCGSRLRADRAHRRVSPA